MPHLLIIGGTGMLREVGLQYVQRGWTVSVVGRRASALAEGVAEAEVMPGRFNPVAVDYTSAESFTEQLRRLNDDVGPPSVLAAWVHSTAPDAPLIAARECAAAAPVPLDFVHVLTRLRTDDPRDQSMPIPYSGASALRAIPGVRYRQAILGWMVEPAGPRWLTKQEISAGVIKAIDSDHEITAIGQIDPIDQCPG